MALNRLDRLERQSRWVERIIITISILYLLTFLGLFFYNLN